ncbi:hypothetical protein HDA41_006796 [Streptomyces caelestis]|uniref:Uncharacterized protein n=1 Tax=Streptomyces caelestis TaxID=36816 RepID=A0A7W9HAS6_9ACTN|nr:hypothetical protein [Streptomyces caelestis]
MDHTDDSLAAGENVFVDAIAPHRGREPVRR